MSESTLTFGFQRPAGNSAAMSALLGNRRLQIAIAFSALLHLLLLSVHFSLPVIEPETRPNRSLDVILVNARHERPPLEADAIAQANLEGGGTVEQDVRPTTPVPPQEVRQDGDALIDASAARPEPAPAPQEVITRAEPVERPPARVAPERRQPDPQPERPQPTASGLDLMDSIAAVARMEAQIDRSLSEYAKRPRTQYIGARAREHRFAQYLEDWRLKIERVGTLNYPEAARGRLYGNLMLSVVIRSDGSVERVEVQRSSGQPLLDEAAIRIVELAAPFAPFPPNIKVDTDVIDITRTWTFTNTDQLRTSR